MNFSFGIITDGRNPDNVAHIIASIVYQNIPNYQILVIGGGPIIIEGDSTFNENIIRYIPFDESIKPKWITKKKNLITQYSKYNNIVFMHDYIQLMPSWYDGFLQFGDDWDICMTRIHTTDKERYRDWCIWYDDSISKNKTWSGKCGVESNIVDRILPPYSYNKIENMYISGAYWVAKKYVMQECPLDNNLVWGQGEDVEWSKRVLLDKKYKYKMNEHSTVRLMKYKDICANKKFNMARGGYIRSNKLVLVGDNHV